MPVIIKTVPIGELPEAWRKDFAGVQGVRVTLEDIPEQHMETAGDGLMRLHAAYKQAGGEAFPVPERKPPSEPIAFGV